MSAPTDNKKLLKEIEESLRELNKLIRVEVTREISECSRKYKKIKKLTGEIDGALRESESTTGR